MDKATIAAGLWAEYLRVDEWCTRSEDDPHSAKVAIRCVATRLGVYPEFVGLDDSTKEDG